MKGALLSVVLSMALVKPSTQSNNCNKSPFNTAAASCNAQTACKWVDNMSPKCDDMCGRWDRAFLEATDYEARNSAETSCTYSTDSKCEVKWNGERKLCVPKTASATKTCTCSNGKKAEDAACTTDGANICVSCIANFYKDGNLCKPCPAGKYQASGTFTGSSCATKVCKCTNGNGATGTTCPTHDTPFCASCDAGYRKNGNSCTACTAGKFQSQPSHTGSTCSACAKGKIAAGPAATTCTECTSGKYAASTGSSSCAPHSTPCPSSGNKVEFTKPTSSTNRECISCGDLKNRYSGQAYNGQSGVVSVNCAKKDPICSSNPKCAEWKKLHKDSKCSCTAPTPAPASRR